jgi:hypothetical protein
LSYTSRGDFAKSEAAMTAVDPELERHRRTWIGFTWFIKISLLVIVVILAGMAIFLV